MTIFQHWWLDEPSMCDMNKQRRWGIAFAFHLSCICVLLFLYYSVGNMMGYFFVGQLIRSKICAEVDVLFLGGFVIYFVP